jgi:Xaa-Pro aminopeptidase
MIKKASDIKKLLRIKNIGVDERSMSAEIYTNLKKWNLKIIPSARIIQNPRNVKTEEEIEYIKKAIKMTKSAIAAVDIYGKSEDHVKREIECEFICRGGEKAFDPIIASGYNSAFVHHNPTAKKLVGKYEFVIVDVGAKVNGYCSDITRSFYPPFKKAKKIHDNVYQIQRSLIRSIKPGVKVSSIQKLYEKMMAKQGYKVMHSFGHGVGLDVHEPLGDKFKENMVLTVEPGVYIRGFGGCRIEDMVVVRKTRARVIS